jgi:hypothetical protein
LLRTEEVHVANAKLLAGWGVVPPLTANLLKTILSGSIRISISDEIYIYTFSVHLFARSFRRFSQALDRSSVTENLRALSARA